MSKWKFCAESPSFIVEITGGSILNGAFQRAGVIDELSLVVDPVIGGEGKPLCMDSHVEEYRLTEVKNHDGILWLHYKKDHAC